MLTYAKLAKTPTKFQRFTGLAVEELDQLVADIEPMWKANVESRGAKALDSSSAAVCRGFLESIR